jgi:hypothetical protein
LKLANYCILIAACFTTTCFAQRAPWPVFAPSFPKTFQECQTFAAAINRYSQEAQEAHTACLNNNAPDRPNEKPDSPLCSRSSCQHLHDIIHSNEYEPLSVSHLQKELADCNEQVRKHLAEEQKDVERRLRAKQEADASRAAEEQRHAEYLNI